MYFHFFFKSLSFWFPLQFWIVFNESNSNFGIWKWLDCTNQQTRENEKRKKSFESRLHTENDPSVYQLESQSKMLEIMSGRASYLRASIILKSCFLRRPLWWAFCNGFSPTLFKLETLSGASVQNMLKQNNWITIHNLHRKIWSKYQK